MAKKQTYDSYVDNSVAKESQTIDEFEPIPVGKIAKVLKFGGYDTLTDGVSGIIALQLGVDSEWKTIRAGGNGCFEYLVNEDYVGDGNKKFRIVRTNKSKENKEMFVWLNIIVL